MIWKMYESNVYDETMLINDDDDEMMILTIMMINVDIYIWHMT